MSQISPPVRILLIGAVVFLAAWFTVLRPKPATIEPATTTTSTQPQTGLGKAVEKAKAVAGKKDTTTKTESSTATTTAPAAKPETAPAVAIPAEALAKLPKRVAKALEGRKVLVLGVLADDPKSWRPLADDDRYVRNALRKTNRYDGDVVVKEVGITDLSSYGAIINDLNVTQSPSIVVVDRNLKGTVLTGYVDRIAINQAIADARDASTSPDITDPYLRQVNALCGRYDLRLTRWSLPTVRGEKAAEASAARLLKVGRTYRREIARVDAPAKWRSLRAETLRLIDVDIRTATAIIKAGKNGDVVGVKAALRSVDRKAVVRLDRRFDELGVTSCVGNRRS